MRPKRRGGIIVGSLDVTNQRADIMSRMVNMLLRAATLYQVCIKRVIIGVDYGSVFILETKSIFPLVIRESTEPPINLLLVREFVSMMYYNKFCICL